MEFTFPPQSNNKQLSDSYIGTKLVISYTVLYKLIPNICLWMPVMFAFFTLHWLLYYQNLSKQLEIKTYV